MTDKLLEIKKALQGIANKTHSDCLCWSEAENALALFAEIQNEQAVDVEVLLDDLIDRAMNDLLVLHSTPCGKPHDPDPQIYEIRGRIVEMFSRKDMPRGKDMPHPTGSTPTALYYHPAHGLMSGPGPGVAEFAPVVKGDVEAIKKEVTDFAVPHIYMVGVKYAPHFVGDIIDYLASRNLLNIRAKE